MRNVQHGRWKCLAGEVAGSLASGKELGGIAFGAKRAVKRGAFEPRARGELLTPAGGVELLGGHAGDRAHARRELFAELFPVNVCALPNDACAFVEAAGRRGVNDDRGEAGSVAVRGLSARDAFVSGAGRRLLAVGMGRENVRGRETDRERQDVSLEHVAGDAL